jgi:hypothetical protein
MERRFGGRGALFEKASFMVRQIVADSLMVALMLPIVSRIVLVTAAA